MPTHIIASCFALATFAVAIVAGLAVDNPAMTTLKRALAAMCLAYPVGWLIGWMGHRAVREHLENYKREHPIEPQEADETTESIEPETPQAEAGPTSDAHPRENAA